METQTLSHNRTNTGKHKPSFGSQVLGSAQKLEAVASPFLPSSGISLGNRRLALTNMFAKRAEEGSH